MRHPGPDGNAARDIARPRTRRPPTIAFIFLLLSKWLLEKPGEIEPEFSISTYLCAKPYACH